MTRKVYAPGLIVLLSAVCLTSIASARTNWWRTYGGVNYDVGNSVQQTIDGGYVIAGGTISFGAGNSDVYLVKTNAQGDTVWTKTYGGWDTDWGYSVQQTADSGYIVAGATYSLGAGSADAYLIKTDASGDTLWTRTYGGANGDGGFSVRQTTDGGYIIVGWTECFGSGAYDVYLIKTNPSGDTLWTKTYGGTYNDEGYYVQQTTDSGYIIAGYTNSFGTGSPDLNNVYLIKTKASGDTLWTRAYGGTGVDWGYSVEQTSDSGYVVVGCTQSFGAGIDDVYLIKTNAQGDTLWTRTYGGLDDDVGNSVQQIADGGYIIAGYTGPFGAGNQDVYLAKVDASGDTLWTRTYGGPYSDEGNSVRQTADSGYIVAGYAKSFGAGNADVYLIKTDANGRVAGIEEPLARHPASPKRFLVRPNPFTSFARVPGHETDVFVLSDVTGRHVAVCKGDRIGAGLRPGVYFLAPVGVRAGNAATATIVKTAF